MCGFIAMISDRPVANLLSLGLQTMQHRGQDASGMATLSSNQFHLVKDMGMASAVLTPTNLNEMHGNAGIAHVRYPTAGSEATSEDAQPFITRRPGIALAHNGNVINVPELRIRLKEVGFSVFSNCDAEPILLVFAAALLNRRPSGHSVDDVAFAVSEVYRQVRGSYSVVALMEVDNQPTIVAFRDPHGIRPAVFGQGADGTWVVASESVALDVLAVERTGDLPLGDVVLLRAGQPMLTLPVRSPFPRHCVFERIYFARPDSIMEGDRVNKTRWLLGRQVAQEWRKKGHQADVVIAIPDTSRPAAQAIADELGVRHREGFIKNRYSGRTFIMPDQTSRNTALRLKLNPISEMFEDNRVILVDDSIVRGNTMGRIVEMIQNLRPKEIHLVIFSPPVRHPCFYGIDMPSAKELIATRWDATAVEDEMATHLGVDSVTYITQPGLSAVCGPNICDACFSGDYVVDVTDTERTAIEADRRG